MEQLRRPRKKDLPADVQEMLARGEDDTLDFKIEISSPAKIARTLVAFANHRGGTLLVGVDDDRSLRGVQADEEVHMLTVAATEYCRPPLTLDIREHGLKKKSILEATVPEGTDKPYYARDEDGKWWAYIRVEDRSLLASKVMLEVMKRRTREQRTLIEYTEREQQLLRYLTDHDRITLKEYCKLSQTPRRQAQHILVNLASVGILRIDAGGTEETYSLVQRA